MCLIDSEGNQKLYNFSDIIYIVTKCQWYLFHNQIAAVHPLMGNIESDGVVICIDISKTHIKDGNFSGLCHFWQLL